MNSSCEFEIGLPVMPVPCRLLAAAVATCCFPAVGAVTGVDVSEAISQSAWECLTSPGGQGPVQFAVVRAWRSTGSGDPNAAATIKAARAAGIKFVDAYIFPCYSCGDPAGQIRQTVDGLHSGGAAFGMVWLDIERYAWSSSLASNQAFIKSMIDECKALGISAGVYSSYYSWQASRHEPRLSLVCHSHCFFFWIAGDRRP